MTCEIERERAFLIKKLPSNIKNCKPKLMRMGDFYNPNVSEANRIDNLNIRSRGDKYEIRKKEGDNEYEKIEHSINITKEEFDLLMTITTQKHEKYYFEYPLFNNLIAEIDIYIGKLKGYARVEVEFNNAKEQEGFTPPDWFGPEITPWNHEIHKRLGVITFGEIKERYKQKGIDLKPVYMPAL